MLKINYVKNFYIFLHTERDLFPLIYNHPKKAESSIRYRPNKAETVRFLAINGRQAAITSVHTAELP